jgi:hypothetical protein
VNGGLGGPSLSFSHACSDIQQQTGRVFQQLLDGDQEAHGLAAVDGKVEILPMMYLALSYDHRIIDGRESVGFLVSIKELLEDPTRLLLDV